MDISMKGVLLTTTFLENCKIHPLRQNYENNKLVKAVKKQ